ncbi:MAG: DUF6088 family protein [Erythrobacter sp.]
MALTRLTQSGHIRRIGRGLYDYPKLHDRFGALTPDADAIAQAVATQGGDKLVRSGAQAANRLGLSTQVPAKAELCDKRANARQEGCRSHDCTQAIARTYPRQRFSPRQCCAANAGPCRQGERR